MFGTAAILAGGKSSRMGFDKQLLMADDRPVLEGMVQTLKEEFSDVLIVTAKAQLYEDMDVRICSDTYADKGPLAGVHAALCHARSRYVYLLACDMPVVNLDFVRHLKRKLLDSRADICAGKYRDRVEPFNAFYARSLLDDVVYRLETGNSSLFRFIYASRSCIIPQEEAAVFDKELQMFTNINTRSEYEKYLGAAAETLSGETEALVDKLEIVRYIRGEYVPMRDLMVHEAALRVQIDGETERVLYCSPAERRELLTGFLFTQGYIHAPKDIASMELDEETETASICLRRLPRQEQKAPKRDVVFDPEILLENQQHFYDGSILQKATAGTHCCALCDDSGTYFSCVDISRHNAMDKVVGKALLTAVSLEDKYILTSGRIPMDMIQKAAAAGIPMIVSRSTPTIAAVETARSANITLLGFSRENRFNIYSAPQRLRGCAFDIAAAEVRRIPPQPEEPHAP